MSLKAKRLMRLEEGTVIEIHYGNGLTFMGAIVEKDDTSLALQSENQEVVVDYDDISSFIVHKDNNISVSTQTNIKKVEEHDEPCNYFKSFVEPQDNNDNSSVELNKFGKDIGIKVPFCVEINEIDSSEEEIKRIYNSLDKPIIKKFKAYYTKYYFNRSPEKPELAAKTLPEIYRAIKNDEIFKDNESIWTILALMMMDSKFSFNKVMPIINKSKNYALIAEAYFINNLYSEAYLYSSIAALQDKDIDDKNKIYTMILKCCLEFDDAGGAIKVLLEKGKNEINTALLDALYEAARTKKNPYWDYSQLVKNLSNIYNNKGMAEKIDNFILTNNIVIKKSAHEEETLNEDLLDEDEIFDFDNNIFETELEEKTELKEAINSTDNYGIISELLWLDEKGKIMNPATAEKEVLEFSYDDIKDRQLKSKIKDIMTSDVMSRQIRVIFDIKNSLVVNIRGIDCKSSADIIGYARSIIHNRSDVERFADEADLLSTIIEKHEPKAEVLSEYINACLSYDNAIESEESEPYLKRSIDLYHKYDKKINHDLRYDSVILSITTKKGSFKDKTSCLERLLTYDRLAPQQRMVYISSLADTYFKEAQAKNKTEYYEKAKNLYLEWESDFRNNKEIFSAEPMKKTYNNHILINAASCNISLGNIETAEQILQGVLRFDPNIDMAIKLLHDIDTTVEQEEKEEEDSEEEVVEDHSTYLRDYSYDEEDYSYDNELPNLENIQPYCDVAGIEELGITLEDALDYFFKFNGDCKCVYSLTYLKALSNINEAIFGPFYNAVSLALDNPLEKLSYSSNDLMLSFDVDLGQYERIIPYCLACATLRSAFYQTTGTDYSLTSLCASVQLSSEYPKLGEILNIMSDFKNKCSKGMDAFAKYRCLDTSTQESKLSDILKNIKDIYEQEFTGNIPKEYISQLRFKVTKAIVYKKDGILETVLRSIKDNDINTFEENRKVFADTFIRNGTEIHKDNIQNNKIEAFIDSCWYEAGNDPRICERKTSDLMGSLRNNLRSHITNIVTKICDWCELYDNGVLSAIESDEKTEYLKIKSTVETLLTKLRDELKPVDSEMSCEEITGRCFLEKTVDEILRKMTGEWSHNERKYYFVDFLKTNYILLDSNFIPDLSSTFCSFPDFNIIARLKKHIEDPDKSMEKNLDNIYSRNKIHNNFGTAKLIQEYANEELKTDALNLREDYNAFIEQAESMLKISYKQFGEYILLANAKGQIMLYDNFMCGIDDVVLYWFAECLKNKNFGFFFELVAACKQKVRTEASSYENKLLSELDEMEKNTPEVFRKEETKNQVIEQIKNQNFLVAEDWMNRLRKDDFYNPAPSNIEVNDYLKSFWEEFETNYEASKDTGTTLKLQVNRGGYIPAKDKKGGMSLISSWLSNGVKASTVKIENILNALGWENVNITDESTNAIEQYRVKFKNKLSSNKRIYPHPLSAFGTASANFGFNVVCLYGYFTADRLIEKYKELDSTRGNKIILLDFALSAAERRRLARKVKEMQFTNVYILVDRVAVLFIANNYVAGGNNKILMAITMPFAYYQPYIPESNAPIPPEIFKGREAELLSIESPTGANLLYGGRQLGKTAILNKAASDIDSDDIGRRAIVIDVRNLDYKSALKLITERLVLAGIISEDCITDDWETFRTIMCKRLNDKENYLPFLLLMLDEADAFIKSSEENDYEPLNILKSIQYTSEGHFKFVVAGLHNLVRFNRKMALGNNSVIPHFPYVNILPFKYNEAKELLVEPLKYLGLYFSNENDVLISQILAATNYFPGLIQLYCKKLIEAMKIDYASYNEADTPPYIITEEHIKKVLTDKSFREEIKEKFSITLTLDSDEGSYYYTIALIIALLDQDGENNKGYTAEDIYHLAEDFDIEKIVSLDTDKIKTLLYELKDLNILKEIRPEKFIFSTKNFRDMLGSKNEVFDELVKNVEGD